MLIISAIERKFLLKVDFLANIACPSVQSSFGLNFCRLFHQILCWQICNNFIKCMNTINNFLLFHFTYKGWRAKHFYDEKIFWGWGPENLEKVLILLLGNQEPTFFFYQTEIVSLDLTHVWMTIIDNTAIPSHNERLLLKYI